MIHAMFHVMFHMVTRPESQSTRKVVAIYSFLVMYFYTFVEMFWSKENHPVWTWKQTAPFPFPAMQHYYSIGIHIPFGIRIPFGRRFLSNVSCLGYVFALYIQIKKGKNCEKRGSYKRNLKKNNKFRNFWPKDFKIHRLKLKIFHFKKFS